MLEQVFTLLGVNPRMARERTEIDPTVRVPPNGSHVIIYRTDDEDIITLTVRHSRENRQENL